MSRFFPEAQVWVLVALLLDDELCERNREVLGHVAADDVEIDFRVLVRAELKDIPTLAPGDFRTVRPSGLEVRLAVS